MRLNERMKRVEEKMYTTKLEPSDAPASMDDFYIDTEYLNSVPFDNNEIILFISDKPFAEDEVALTFPPLPFIRSTKNKTRFEIQNDRDRRLRSSIEYPVTQAFIYNGALEPEVITNKKSIYFGISPVSEAVVTAEEQVVVEDADADVIDPETEFNLFLDAVITKRRSGEVTTERIWKAWAVLHGANPDEDVIGGIRKSSVVSRFRARFSPPPATHGRVDGRVQRRWKGYAVIQRDEA